MKVSIGQAAKELGVSANRAKAVKQLAQAHRCVANVRQNALHQATSRLARTKSVVVLEDLNVRGMVQNHHLAQATPARGRQVHGLPTWGWPSFDGN